MDNYNKIYALGTLVHAQEYIFGKRGKDLMADVGAIGLLAIAEVELADEYILEREDDGSL